MFEDFICSFSFFGSVTYLMWNHAFGIMRQAGTQRINGEEGRSGEKSGGGWCTLGS